MSQPDFDSLGIWPVAVKLRGVLGYTLWGDDGTGADVWLDDAGRLPLYTSFSTLWRALPTLAPRLARAEGWVGLLAASADHDGMLEPQRSYDLDAIESVVGRGKGLAYAECSAFVDGLNLIWDGLETLGRADLKAAMRGGTALGAIADALTFVEPMELAAVCSRLPWADGARDLAPIIAALETALDRRDGSAR